MSTSKIIPSTTLHSSKRTTTNDFEPTIDNNATTTLQRSRTHHITRSVTQKDKSGSDEVHTAPLYQEHTKTASSLARQGIGDCVGQDADEESTAHYIRMNKNKTSINNSANHLQQQGMGDHYTNSKQHRNRKHHRSIEQQDQDSVFNKANTHRWQTTIYLLIILFIAFVLYRFLLAIWPKPRKTFLEQLIDNISTLFTP